MSLELETEIHQRITKLNERIRANVSRYHATLEENESLKKSLEDLELMEKTLRDRRIAKECAKE